jgi:hypothetical protein
MAAPDVTTCAACGTSGDLHEHHLVPKVHDGLALPTVFLCQVCHGNVHGRPFTQNHRELTAIGIRKAKAKGKRPGNPGVPDSEAIIRAAEKAAQLAAKVAVIAQLAADRAAVSAARLSAAALEIKAELEAAETKRLAYLPTHRERAKAAARARARQARAKARDILPFLEAARNAGCTTLGQIAAALEARGVKTPSGRPNWSATQVHRIIRKNAETPGEIRQE